MQFEQFIEEVKNEVKLLVGNEYSVSFNCVLKINRKLQGLSVRYPGTSFAPSIYLEDYFTEYQNGKGIRQIAKEIIDVLNRRKSDININPDNIIDYNWAKPRLRVKLINYDRNIELLQSVPYEKMLDLAIVPYILLAKGEEIMSITVNYQLLDNWGVQQDEMLKAAKDNTLIIEPVRVEKMTDFILHMMLKELNEMEEDNNKDDREELIKAIIGKDSGRYEMYILTNHDTRNGAFSALQTDTLSDLADEIETDKLYILPSSIHEVIAIPAYDIRPNDLKEMVMSVNRSEVAEEDFLSDMVYLFDRKSMSIQIAE
ncbi:MAG: DUF5688 family protein [Herbinix sp.]|nr:DUF5688 family protein [Herbinix sp.]